jgi:hypothetical protein
MTIPFSGLSLGSPGSKPAIIRRFPQIFADQTGHQIIFQGLAETVDPLLSVFICG